MKKALKVVLIVFAVLIALGVVNAIMDDDKGQNEDNTLQQSKSESETLDEFSSSAASTPQSTNQSNKEEESWEITYQNSYVYKNSLDAIACYVIVEVENTGNVDLYLDDATFDFEDESGRLLATCSSIISSDPDIIAPGERGYFYCNMAELSGDITENTEYVFNPSLKIEKAKNSIIRYNTTDLSISEGDMMSPFSVIGRVENNTDEDDSLVWVSCIVYRDDGSPIAACGTNVTELAAGQKESFDLSAIWLSALDLDFSEIADYKVYACKAQYQF